MAEIAKIVPSLWYSEKAEEAAKFYTSIFPNSDIVRVWDLQADTPSGPAGSVKVVEFMLCGQPFIAMKAGPLDQFNHAISLSVMCDTQKEVDKYYKALLEGGSEELCGWVKDRFGVSWQIVPRALFDMMADSNQARARRVAEAMLSMKKLDIAALQAAQRSTAA